MLETLFIATLIFLFLNRSKKKRRARSLDGELKELIATDQENKGIALDIKNYLLWIIECNNNDEEKFSDLWHSEWVGWWRVEPGYGSSDSCKV